MGEPLVSVSVITYNSSKYVIETLDSIKNQTYQNIELIVSDDCSTDNTVELCRNWIEENKERFVRTELLTVEKNMGISANLNRAEAVCKGVWVKGVAGDDVLVPECVDICMKYVAENPETVYLFGRQNAFGADKEKCEIINKVFDYSFFKLTRDEQLHRLIFEKNQVPAATGFFNKDKVEKVGVKNDERIPMLEDLPKWINLLKAGVKFDFVDEILVNYRVGGISTSTISSKFYRSGKLFFYLYTYPELVKENFEEAVQRVVDEEVENFEYVCKIQKQLFQIQKSYSYRLGKVIVRPFSCLKRIFSDFFLIL